jgi:hypothetical protein
MRRSDRKVVPAAGELVLLPDSLHELDRIRIACKQMVTKRAAVSAGSVLVPIPGMDIAADMGLLLELLPSINRKFGLTPEQIDELHPKMKVALYGIIKGTGSTLVGAVITRQLVIAVLQKVGARMGAKQVLKWFPLAGQAAAAALSYGAMSYVGNAHVDECYEIAKAAIAGSGRSGSAA